MATPKLFGKLSLPLVIGTILAMVPIIVAYHWCVLKVQERDRIEVNNVHTKLEAVASRLSHSLNERLHHTRSLAAQVRINPDLTHDEFSEFAAILVGSQFGVRSLQLAPGGIVTYLTNIEKNRKAIGHDLFADPDRRQLVEQSVADRAYVIAGPINLIQGGQAIIARRPVFIPNADKTTDTFWGFATILIDVDPMLREAGYYDLDERFSVAVRGKDALGADGAVFVGDEQVFQNSRVTVSIPLVTGSWQLGATWESPGLYAELSQDVLPWTAAILLSAFISFLSYFLWRQPILLRKAIDQATADLELAKNDADRANRAKSEFLAHMSHELRTPLNSIMGFSQVLKLDAVGDITERKRSEYADYILSSGQHLLNLINDVLDLSKIEAGEFTVDLTTIDVAELLNENYLMMLETARQAGVKIRYERPVAPMHIHADARLIKQVVLNLLSNGVKYNVENGAVTLTAHNTQDDCIAIIITDTGVGIKPEDIPKVLEPFGQARVDAHSSHEGTGLGLSISRQLVQLQGGQLDLQSEPGTGTTVTLTFPSAQGGEHQQGIDDKMSA